MPNEGILRLHVVAFGPKLVDGGIRVDRVIAKAVTAAW
jgi:hypothetical protein